MIYRKRIVISLLIVISLFPITGQFCGLDKNRVNQTNVNNPEKDSLSTNDVAGTDLYAENIGAYVVGNKSIIKQSLFSNDTSILPQFDTRDPAFYKCNILISVSNGIVPEIFPNVITESEKSLLARHFYFTVIIITIS